MSSADRRAIEQLAALLDARPGAGRAEFDAEGQADLRLAARLRQVVPSSTVSPQFRQQLRTRLVAVATVQGVGAAAVEPAQTARSGGRWRRAATVAAGAMAGVVAVSGVAVASSRALPGDPFYGVKAGVEALQVRAADGPVARGERHLQLAATRLREVQELSADGASTAQVRDGLAAMDTQVADAGGLLVAASAQGRNSGPLRALTAALTAQQHALAALVPVLPVGNRRQAGASLALLAVWDGRATQLLQTSGRAGSGTAGTAPNPTGPVTPAQPSVGGATSGPTPAPTAASTTGSTTGTPPSAPAPLTRPTAPASTRPSPLVPVLPTPGLPGLRAPGVPTPVVPVPGLPGG